MRSTWGKACNCINKGFFLAKKWTLRQRTTWKHWLCLPSFKEILRWKLCHWEIKETKQNLTNQGSVRQESMDQQHPGNAPDKIFLSLVWIVPLQRISAWFLLYWNTISCHFLPHPEQHLSFCPQLLSFHVLTKFFQLKTMLCWTRKLWKLK